MGTFVQETYFDLINIINKKTSTNVDVFFIIKYIISLIFIIIFFLLLFNDIKNNIIFFIFIISFYINFLFLYNLLKKQIYIKYSTKIVVIFIKLLFYNIYFIFKFYILHYII